jgi:DNA-directed RNA polymerase subunit RPC12/RpoP
MNEKIIDLDEGIECPYCEERIADEEDCVSVACGEPFNRVGWECTNCKREFSIDVKFKISKID